MLAEVESLGVPLCAMVESYGNRFLVQSLSPIDSQSLVYGSSTDGLLVEQSDPVAEDCAATIAKTVCASHFGFCICFCVFCPRSDRCLALPSICEKYVRRLVEPPCIEGSCGVILLCFFHRQI